MARYARSIRPSTAMALRRVMMHLSRLVWREGMYLGQHHFQLQQRYFEDSIRFAIEQLFFKPYGLISWTFDAETLRNGFVTLVGARGLMPDGTPFSFPDSEPAPAPLEIRKLFSPTEHTQRVLLAIPALRRDGANVAASGNGSPAARMHVVERTVR